MVNFKAANLIFKGQLFLIWFQISYYNFTCDFFCFKLANSRNTDSHHGNNSVVKILVVIGDGCLLFISDGQASRQTLTCHLLLSVKTIH